MLVLKSESVMTLYDPSNNILPMTSILGRFLLSPKPNIPFQESLLYSFYDSIIDGKTNNLQLYQDSRLLKIEVPILKESIRVSGTILHSIQNVMNGVFQDSRIKETKIAELKQSIYDLHSCDLKLIHILQSFAKGFNKSDCGEHQTSAVAKLNRLQDVYDEYVFGKCEIHDCTRHLEASQDVGISLSDNDETNRVYHDFVVNIITELEHQYSYDQNALQHIAFCRKLFHLEPPETTGVTPHSGRERPVAADFIHSKIFNRCRGEILKQQFIAKLKDYNKQIKKLVQESKEAHIQLFEHISSACLAIAQTYNSSIDRVCIHSWELQPTKLTEFSGFFAKIAKIDYINFPNNTSDIQFNQNQEIIVQTVKDYCDHALIMYNKFDNRSQRSLSDRGVPNIELSDYEESRDVGKYFIAASLTTGIALFSYHWLSSVSTYHK